MGCRKLIWTPEDEPRASFARGIGGRVSGRRLVGSAPVAAAPFNGNFATLFPGAFQVVQTDLGLTYSGTPLATATNTSTTALALTGTLATVPVPIWAVATNTLAIGAGAQFNIYYDGLGVTPAMVGVTPAVATPVALTGAATGLFLAWSAGASVSADSWKATCAGLADQSGNTKDYSQASSAKQPIITIGLNGKVGLLGDGVDDVLSSTLTLVAPGTTPYTVFLVGRVITWTSGKRIIGSTAAPNGTGSIDMVTATPQLNQTGGAGFGNASNGMVVGSFAALTSYFSGTIADFLRCGSLASVTGTTAGSAASAGRDIYSAGGANFSNFELLMLAYIPANGAGQDTAFRAAVNSAAGYGVGNVLV